VRIVVEPTEPEPFTSTSTNTLLDVDVGVMFTLKPVMSAHVAPVVEANVSVLVALAT
jgi:hypothetical protein